MKLTKAQFRWLKWLADNGGSGYLEGHRIVANGALSLTGADICFLHLVVGDAIKVENRRLVITDHGRRLLTP